MQGQSRQGCIIFVDCVRKICYIGAGVVIALFQSRLGAFLIICGICVYRLQFDKIAAGPGLRASFPKSYRLIPENCRLIRQRTRCCCFVHLTLECCPWNCLYRLSRSSCCSTYISRVTTKFPSARKS